MRALRYRYPQAIYSDAFLSFVASFSAGRPALYLTAQREHARWWQKQISPAAALYCSASTLQSFLLRSVLAQTPLRVLSAYERMAFVEAAWQTVGGPLYAAYGKNRGAAPEMAALLSYMSGQRAVWGTTSDIDPRTELGAVYLAYQRLLTAAGAIGYDDVALHYNALTPEVPAVECICAVELHEANPAQLRALQRLVGGNVTGFVGAWLLHDTEDTQPAPELAAVAAFLTRFPQIEPWSVADTVSRRLIDRLHTPQTPLPGAQYASMHGQTTRLGLDTSTDEVTTAATIAHQALSAGRTVSIVCADTNLIPPIRVALQERGIQLPLHSPGQGANPLIRLARALIDVSQVHEAAHRERAATVCHTILTELNTPTGARTQKPEPAQLATIIATADRLHGAADLADVLNTAVRALGGIVSVWASPTPLPTAIRDHWLREWQQWLETLEEVLRHDGPHDITFLVETLDATPTPERILRDTTLPLQLTDSRGAPSEQDLLLVVGLHEDILPRQPRGYQLITEPDLRAAFTEPVAFLPARTDRLAVRERERRRAARIVASNASDVVLSVAYHGTTGKPQLPTAFFTVWGEGEIHFNDKGDLESSKSPGQPPQTVSFAPLPMPYTAPNYASTVHQALHDNHFSSSQLYAYLKCPRKYFYQKVARTTIETSDDEGDNATLGSLFHEILCAAMGTGATTDVDLRDESLAAFSLKWHVMESRLDAIKTAALTGSHLDIPGGGAFTPTRVWGRALGTGILRAQAIDMLDQLLANWYKAEVAMGHGTTRQPILLEQTVEIDVNGLRVIGRIDRIDAVYRGETTLFEIIDYKTGSTSKISGNDFLRRLGLPPAGTDKKPRALEGEPATDYQTAIYLLAEIATPSGTISANTMRYCYVNSEDPLKSFRTIQLVDGPAAQKSATANDVINLQLPRTDLHTRVVPQMTTLMHQMRQTPYTIKAGRHCAYCEYATICDAVVENDADQGGF